MSTPVITRGFYTRQWHDRLMRLSLRGEALTPPVLELGLSTRPASQDGFIAEPTAPSYSRVAVPAGTFTEPDPADIPVSQNAVELAFTTPTEDWGDRPICSVFLRDTLSGLVVTSIDLTEPRQVLAGDPAPRFEAGSLRFGAV